MIDVNKDDAGVVSSTISANCVLAIFVIISWVVGDSRLPRNATHKFGDFLCHHKEGAGRLARFFK